MNCHSFTQWLHMWYVSVRARSSGPFVLLLDNLSGHENISYLENVTFWFLPAKTTAKFQLMDQGIIVKLKRIYRSFLIDALLRISNEIRAEQHKQEFESDRAFVREGRTAYVADAIFYQTSRGIVYRKVLYGSAG